MNIQDNCYQTAAHLAAEEGATECLRMLIKSGCNIYSEDINNESVIEYIIGLGQATINGRRNSDKLKGYEECIKILVYKIITY